MIPYIAYVSLLLAVTFVVYWLFLKKETFYKLNRFFLSTAIIVSLIIPLITVPSSMSFNPRYIEVTSTTQPDRVLEMAAARDKMIGAIPHGVEKLESISEQALLVEPTTPASSITSSSILSTLKSLNYAQILWYLYLTGVAIFGITFLIQFVIIMLQKSKLEYIQDGKFRIYELTDENPPFSFMRWIFINPALYDLDTYNQILEHEKIHVSQAHYFDKMLAEFTLIFNWFNPFVWLYRKAITNNLEFLTDFEMIGKGTEKESYQYSLLKVSVPQHGLNLTTNYNESFLSERIKMMNAKKSSARSSWKYLLIFPLLALSMASLNAVKPIYLDYSETRHLQNAVEDAIVSKVISKKDANNTDKNIRDVKSKETSSSKTTNKTTSTTTSKTTNITAGQKAANNKLDVSQELDNQAIAKQMGDEVLKTTKLATEIMQEVLGGMNEAGIPTGDKNPIDFDNFMKSFEKETRQSIGQGKVESKVEHKTKHKTKQKTQEDSNVERDYGSKSSSSSSSSSSSKTSCATKCKNCNNEKCKTKCKNVCDNHGVRPGKWSGKIKREELCVYLNMTNQFNNSQWTLNTCLLINEISNFGYGDDVNFKITRDAGTLALDGEMNRVSGEGAFNFEPNPDFVKFIRNELNEKSVEDREVFLLFANKIGRDFLKDIKSNGYDLDFDQILEFGIFGIDSKKLDEYKRIEQKLGAGKLSAKKMVEMSIHGVDEAYVDELLGMKYDDLEHQDVVAAKIHGVDRDLVKGLKSYGYKSLDLQRVIEMSIHGISGAYLQSFEDVGLRNVSPQKMVEFAIHGVKAKDIEVFTKLGFDQNASKFVEAKIHNVTARYAQSIKDAGIQNLTLQQLINAKIHGVTSSFVKKAKSRGHNTNRLPDYINLRIHGF